MHKFLLFLFLFPCISLSALRIDPNSASFSQREKKHIEQYDFQGDYLELKNIDIDARKKMHVELLLSGNYPVLEKINFMGGFGAITGNLTGSFPKLKEIAIACTKATLDLDLDAKWDKECLISVVCTGPTTINLPKNTGFHLTVCSSPLGKVDNQHPSLEKRKTKLGKPLQRIFMTPKEEGKERLLTIVIKTDRETVTLK